MSYHPRCQYAEPSSWRCTLQCNFKNCATFHLTLCVTFEQHNHFPFGTPASNELRLLFIECFVFGKKNCVREKLSACRFKEVCHVNHLPASILQLLVFGIIFWLSVFYMNRIKSRQAASLRGAIPFILSYTLRCAFLL